MLARRKPRLLLRLPGELWLRLAARTLRGSLFQLPPRFTRLASPEPCTPGWSVARNRIKWHGGNLAIGKLGENGVKQIQTRWVLGLMLIFGMGVLTTRLDWNGQATSLGEKRGLRRGAERVALVIGNKDYQDTRHLRPLTNPVNDATDVAKVLEGFGFEVQTYRNLNKDEMNEAIAKFGRTATNADAALFFYSGHAIQNRNQNYLMPVNAKVPSLALVTDQGVNINTLLEEMDNAKSQVNIVMLDACRDNPFNNEFRSAGAVEGLAQPSFMPKKGTVIVYATDPGNTAADGRGRNGVFTTGLLEAFKGTDLSLDGVLTVASERVDEISEHTQMPYVNGPKPLQKHFYFAGRKDTPPPPPLVTPPRPQPVPVVIPPPPLEIEPEMVDIPGGTFQMGSPESEKDRDPDDEGQHLVKVEGFKLGKTEVTVGAFRRFVEATGYKTDAERNAGGKKGCWAYDQSDKDKQWEYRDWASWRKPNLHQGNKDQHPVSCVSWNDAQAYIEWLNKNTAGGYRLPTEAEWEYAARGGTKTARYWGNDPNQACRYANVADQSAKQFDSSQVFQCSDGYAYAASVGSFKPNKFGLYDMLGNVWEWTCSEYDKDYGGKEKDCQTSGDAYRVYRGGSWDGVPRRVRAAFRSHDSPGDRLYDLGFRLARTL